jgi:hypothetical protein
LYAIDVRADIKVVLYSAIDKIGKEKIRIQINGKIEKSEGYCDEILERCRGAMNHNIDDETAAALCEALLHFMLTASVLPSQRKVNWRGVELDIVIPSLKILDKHPSKALVIQIIKKGNDLTKIKQAESVQPHHRNIWVVSARQLDIKHRNYCFESRRFPYSRIISDIHAFLIEEGDSGLKLLHGD